MAVASTELSRRELYALDVTGSMAVECKLNPKPSPTQT